MPVRRGRVEPLNRRWRARNSSTSCKPTFIFYPRQKADTSGMNTTANSDAGSSFIVPAADDANDQAYRFGKPLTYLSDRQQVRLVILRSQIREAHASYTLAA